jgi:hypothetical protein
MSLAPKIRYSPHNKPATLFALFCCGAWFAYRWVLKDNEIKIKRHGGRRLGC